MSKYKLGCCSRCGSTNIVVHNEIVECMDCHDWEWFEDAIDSCWNGYIEADSEV